MTQKTRGAASVSVMWLIFLLVLLFAAGGGLYVLMSERASKDQQIADLQKKFDGQLARNQAVTDEYSTLSTAIGFKADPNDPYSSVAAVNGRLQTLRDTYDWLGPNATSLEAVIDAATTQVDAINQQIAELRQQLQAAEDARAAAEDNMRTQLAAKDQEIADLTTQLQDERDRAASQESQDATRLADLQTQVENAQAALRAAEDEKDRAIANAEDQITGMQGQVRELRRKLEFTREPETPDGSVLAVSNVGTCYINRGKEDMLRPQTRFRVFRYGKGGAIELKGLIEVRGVMESQAEAGVIEQYDEFDPIAPGDLIAAPLYDPEVTREFVLAGRFPTGYSKPQVANRLRSLGARVADGVSETTDFLIVGDAEPLASADGDATVDPRESKEFQKAKDYQVQILPVRDILDFLRYD